MFKRILSFTMAALFMLSFVSLTSATFAEIELQELSEDTEGPQEAQEQPTLNEETTWYEETLEEINAPESENRPVASETSLTEEEVTDEEAIDEDVITTEEEIVTTEEDITDEEAITVIEEEPLSEETELIIPLATLLSEPIEPVSFAVNSVGFIIPPNEYMTGQITITNHNSYSLIITLEEFSYYGAESLEFVPFMSIDNVDVWESLNSTVYFPEQDPTVIGVLKANETAYISLYSTHTDKVREDTKVFQVFTFSAEAQVTVIEDSLMLEPVGMELVDEELIDTEPIDEEPIDEEAADTEPVDEEPVDATEPEPIKEPEPEIEETEPQEPEINTAEADKEAE